MTGYSSEGMFFSPSAISIHYNGDVLGKLLITNFLHE
jgi:hypothetical protein